MLSLKISHISIPYSHLSHISIFLTLFPLFPFHSLPFIYNLPLTPFLYIIHLTWPTPHTFLTYHLSIIQVLLLPPRPLHSKPSPPTMSLTSLIIWHISHYIQFPPPYLGSIIFITFQRFPHTLLLIPSEVSTKVVNSKCQVGSLNDCTIRQGQGLIQNHHVARISWNIYTLLKCGNNNIPILIFPWIKIEN